MFSPCSRSVVAHVVEKHADLSLVPKTSSDVKSSQNTPKDCKDADVPQDGNLDGNFRKCPLCSVTYQHKKSLVAHMKREHEIDKDDKRIKSLPPSPKVSE